MLGADGQDVRRRQRNMEHWQNDRSIARDRVQRCSNMIGATSTMLSLGLLHV